MTRLLAPAALLLAAGCAGTADEPPRFDVSTADGYGAVAFRDDAPANARVAVGDFPLHYTGADGRPVDLGQYRGQKKVVLIVLRGVPAQYNGAFCPGCLAQVGSLTAHRAEFAARGAEVVVVFPGPADRLGEFLRRAGEDDPAATGRAFHVLLDRECAACDRLGIRDDLARPSTYVLDTRGAVVYAYVGETSTDRPSVRAVLAQLDRAE